MAAHADGGGATLRRHKFFKILLPGCFESSLCLPPMFAARLRCPRDGATATLRDPAGRPWDPELHRDGRYLCFAGRGWRGFVAGTGLSAGHLLVFKHLGGLDFSVEPFDATGCLIVDDDAGDRGGTITINNTASTCQLDTTADAETDTTADVESGNDDGCRRVQAAAPWAAGTRRKRSAAVTAATSAGSSEQSGDDGTLTLRRHIQRPSQLKYLELTKVFCDRAGWTTSRTVILTVAGGDRRWEVGVKVGSKGGMMMGGWMEFAHDNRLKISDTCVFKPLLQGTCGDLLQIQVLRGSASSKKS